MTHALILAAGQGTRLRPLTNDKPKCLVELMGISLLERQLETLASAGINTIHVATGYRSDQIVALGLKTSLNPKFEQTNMVETLFSAREFMGSGGDLLISYGDIVYQDNNLQAVLEMDDEITLMIDTDWDKLWSLRLENPLDDAETLRLDAQGYVTELGKKPRTYEDIEGQYTGLIKIREDKIPSFMAFYDALDRGATYDGKDFDNMYMTSFLQALIHAGWQAKAALVKNGWLEIDSVADLETYEGLAQADKLTAFYNVS